MPTTIELEKEALIPLKEVPRHLPKRKGKKFNYATIWRWTNKGSRGRVLESVLVGGIRFTSVAALNRFLETSSIQAKHPEAQQDLRSVMYGKKAG